jgi:DNA-binding MarR family transcriptional regulator/GNAT superfamily N-acetyltransferase
LTLASILLAGVMRLMSDPAFEQRVNAVRRFSRFYTRKIGLLQDGLLDSPFSLTQARVLYELAHTPDQTATDIAAALAIDPGYLSRILRAFDEQGLIDRKRAPADGRQVALSLTTKGRKAFAALDHRSQRDMGAILGKLSLADQECVVAAMRRIETLLGGGDAAAARYHLRPHRPGDLGWVISAHGALYAQEYGWDISFEAMVADIVAQFIRRFDPKREHCWIAEMDGEPVGSVFLVKGDTEDVAKLRLLIVDPKARGLGLGRRLVDECIAFARARDYRQVTLWTQSILASARRIYKATGFRLVDSKPHISWGASLVGETWRLDL